MGVDTVKLSYRMTDMVQGYQWIHDDRPYASVRAATDRPWGSLAVGGWRKGRHYGTQGPLWWCERVHVDGTRVMVKGIGSDAYILWEGSIGKYLGLVGVAQAEHVRIVDRHLRSLIYTLPKPDLRRVDLTHDECDPEGLLRVAALGWNPHARSRYVQAEYQGGETVWQHNKSRGVRVYDKHAESGEDWAIGLTRIEYQTRGDWCRKLGIDRLHSDFEQRCEDALRPVVSDLMSRVSAPERLEDSWSN